MLENVENGSIIEVKILTMGCEYMLYVVENYILGDVQFLCFIAESIEPNYHRFKRGEIFSMSGVQLNYLLHGANKYETWTVL